MRNRKAAKGVAGVNRTMEAQTKYNIFVSWLLNNIFIQMENRKAAKYALE